MVVDIFNVDDKTYEIHFEKIGFEYKIQVKSQNKPANGYYYTVQLDQIYDLEEVAGKDAIKELIKIAKNDVIEHTYEKLIKALQQSK